MPLEVTCDDTQKVKITANPNGRLDGPPTWDVMSGNGTVEPDANGLSAYVVSEDNVQGDGPFDTTYHVTFKADGVELGGDNDIILHVNNNPATSAGFTVGTPEPK